MVHTHKLSEGYAINNIFDEFSLAQCTLSNLLHRPVPTQFSEVD